MESCSSNQRKIINSSESIEMAQEMDQATGTSHVSEMDIIEDLHCEIVHPVTENIINSILSYDTEKIQALCIENNVIVGFQNKHLYISGKNSACEEAFSAIMTIVAERKELFEHVAAHVEKGWQVREYAIEKFTVPSDSIGIIAGKQFANKERLEATYGIKVGIPPKGNGNEIVLKGLDASNVAAAKADILNSIPHTITQPIEGQYVGLIIGRQGECINRLSKNHNVNIEITNNIVVITGPLERCNDALKEVNVIIDKQKEQNRRAAAYHSSSRWYN